MVHVLITCQWEREKSIIAWLMCWWIIVRRTYRSNILGQLAKTIEKASRKKENASWNRSRLYHTMMLSNYRPIIHEIRLEIENYLNSGPGHLTYSTCFYSSSHASQSGME